MCGATPVEAAHTVGRKYDATIADTPLPDFASDAFSGFDPQDVYVHPEEVVPLCRACHTAYDEHRLDLLPYLTYTEQARVALHLGLVRGLRRTTGAPDDGV